MSRNLDFYTSGLCLYILTNVPLIFTAIAPSFEKNGFGPFYLFNEREGRLKCDPEAAPRPSQFKWYKEGKELTSARYSVTADGTLVINKVNRGDAGRYTCYAKNFLGEATSDPSSATVLSKKKHVVILLIILCFLSFNFCKTKG